ncbi:hypothetical protein PAHAL_5G184400 [Panicum hallii]|uniref:Leucine-rich repeat-containing N-terminal plant-type domain-containing protein n=1 Tax=Panicum hallii TaxID=206008 RepID=A0A2T8IKD8_9POAL|nr:hypothetical protein PAHAL_5G184400 [Panicum hallii]
MALWRAMFLLVFLLAVKVQYVSCPGDTWHRTATLASHLDTSAPAPQPDRSDICGNHTVSCKPAESSAAKAIVDFNSAVSSFFIVPMIRVLRLEHNSRTESDTQFWWYLCCGSSG